MATLEINTQACLSLAKDAAREAGKFLVSLRKEKPQVSKSVGKDVKLKEDVASEKIILDLLKSKSKFPVLSEEAGWTASDGAKGLFWAVDPIDGTMNYSRGLPLSCVSIGLWDGANPVLGVVYDFNRDELFSGIVGSGAWLNDQTIHVSQTPSIDQAVLSTGFPLQTEFSEANVREFIQSVIAYKKIRMIGSAALSLAYVACGRVDVYFERDIMLWDIAGGLPIILGAGGSVSKEPSKKDSQSFTVYACNPIIFKNLEK